MPKRSVDGLASGPALEAIRVQVGELITRQGRLWKREMRPALTEAGMEITTIDECCKREQEKLARHFEREIFPILTPLRMGSRPGVPLRLRPFASHWA